VSVSRDVLATVPAAYFEAVDAKDLDATIAFFADDATFTVQTALLTWSGAAEIATMFRGFFGGYAKIRHEITNLVVDEKTSRSATEQYCPHVRNDGVAETLTTCNSFSFSDDGRFQRVIVWIDGGSPLR
jgi:ketosteroid isomerase-like protein